MNSDNRFKIESGLFISLFDAMPFNVYVADIETFELIFINQRLKQNIGEIQNKKCYQAIYQQDSPCLHCNVQKLIDKNNQPSGETKVSELFNEFDDKWYQLQDKCVSWPDGRVVKYTIGVDITEQKLIQNDLAEAHAKLAIKSKLLEKLSVTDSLTQLNNRLKLDALLTSEFERAERYGRCFSVILMDLDKFKNVNDKFGHLVGDKVLVEASRVIKQYLRNNDVAGRWGGEEFMILCPETHLEDASIVADKLRRSLFETRFTEVGNVTASFGVASFASGESLEQLLNRVDNALYEAKGKGRNSVVAFNA